MAPVSRSRAAGAVSHSSVSPPLHQRSLSVWAGKVLTSILNLVESTLRPHSLSVLLFENTLCDRISHTEAGAGAWADFELRRSIEISLSGGGLVVSRPFSAPASLRSIRTWTEGDLRG
jgi:hypothetical protein